MQRILILTNVFPWPPAIGFNRRLANLIGHLRRKGHAVDMLVIPEYLPGEERIERARQNVEQLHVIEFFVDRLPWHTRLRQRLGRIVQATGSVALERFARRVLKVIRKARRLADRSVGSIRGPKTPSAAKQSAAAKPGYSFTRAQQHTIREFIEQGDYDAVIVEHAMMASAVRPRARDNRLWLIDVHDIMHRRVSSYGRLGLPVYRVHNFTLAEERAALDFFDVIIAIQDEEKELLAKMMPEKTVICAGVDSTLNRIRSTRNEVAFIGSAAQGNRHGITEILRNAWPEVLRARPDAVLRIYGKICTVEEVVRAKGALKKSLILHGVVDDLTEAYRAAVVIAPLWAGSGLKIKVVEALCHGKAVITTPTGAQGLADGAGRAFRVAETPAEFAASILDLLEHPGKREALADAAYRYAAEKFSENHVYKELDQVLERSPVRLARSA